MFEQKIMKSPKQNQKQKQSTVDKATVSVSNGDNLFVEPQSLPRKSLFMQFIEPLGRLRILPAKPQKFKSGDKKIQIPNNVEHTISVYHNKNDGKYVGLPKEWMKILNKQFGVAPKLLPSVQLPQYSAKIPRILIQLKSILSSENGFHQVGIFRLAPNSNHNNAIKAKIDSGEFDFNEEKVDFNVYANLIKVWFRDLPDPLLNCVAPELIENINTQDDVIKIVAQLPEPNQSVFLWLCDMCVEVSAFEDENKMGPKNLAIVIAPNLFDISTFQNPTKAISYTAKVVEFFKISIIWRQQIQNKINGS